MTMDYQTFKDALARLAEPRRARNLALAGCAVLVVLIWALVLQQLRYERQSAVDAAIAQTGGFAKAFEEQVLGIVRTADLALREVDAGYGKLGRNLDLQKYARERQASLAPFSILSVTDENGDLLTQSLPIRSPLNFRNTDNFQFHAAHDTDELHVGKSRRGFTTGKWTLYLSRRINKVGGAFGGMASAGIDAAYLSRFYDQVGLGADSVVALVGRDGIVRARYANGASTAGEDMGAGSVLAKALPSGDQGSVVGKGMVDGVPRIFSYRALERVPLVVVVGVSEAAALAPYQERKWVYLAWASAMSLVILLFGLALAAQMTRQARTNQVRRDAEQRFRDLAELGSDWYWEQDASLRFTAMSAELYAKARLSPTSTLGKHRWDLPVVGMSGEAWQAHRALLERHEPFRDLTYQMANEVGELRWFSISGRPVFGADGEFRGYRGSGRDITESRRIEEVRGRLAAIVENSSDAILSRSLDGTITSWNAGAAKMFGHAAAEVVGRNVSLIVPPDRAHEYAANTAALNQGQSVHQYDTVRIAKDGRRIDVSLSFSPIRNDAGEIGGIAIIMRDISARRAAEEEILRLNAQLEQRVAERTAQLEATVGELQIAVEEMESFTYTVAHDLRSPLRAMHGFSTILVDDYGTAIAEEGRGYLERVAANAQRMGNLIDDLLEFSRYARQAMHKQPVDAGALVRAVVAEQVSARVEVRIGELPPCQADPALLRQVWTNLVSNAVKYSGAVASPLVEIGFAAGAYFVRDNGVGFDMAYAGKLFGVFQRLHRTEDFEGTGVGLAIVKRIVLRHGGRVWAQAEAGKGASFFFSLGQG